MEKKCRHCQESFIPLPNVKKQSYCSKSSCQKARKRAWHQAKMESDQDYQRNQADTQTRWSRGHPEYWKAYRETHPDYTSRNRLAQRERNQRRRHKENQLIAKMDESNPTNSEKSFENKLIHGTYLLTHLDESGIAKMDEWKVKIVEIKDDYTSPLSRSS